MPQLHLSSWQLNRMQTATYNIWSKTIAPCVFLFLLSTLLGVLGISISQYSDDIRHAEYYLDCNG